MNGNDAISKRCGQPKKLGKRDDYTYSMHGASPGTRSLIPKALSSDCAESGLSFATRSAGFGFGWASFASPVPVSPVRPAEGPLFRNRSLKHIFPFSYT